MAIKNIGIEEKMQPIVDELEDLAELIHEDKWTPVENEDGVYQGEIAGYMSEFDAELDVAKVPDEDDAHIICGAVSHLKALVAYVRYLERKVERLSVNKSRSVG